MTVQLRPYQDETLHAIERERGLGVRRTAVVLPTGAGKTTVFGELGRRWIAGGGRRVLYVAHRDELILQARDRLRRMAPGQSVGIVQADANQALAQHVVASVQTIGGKRGLNRRRQIQGVDLVVVDEAHHSAAATYMDVLSHFDAFTVGFTATLTRADRKALGKVFTSVAYELPLHTLIDDGYLVRPVGVRVQVDDLDLSKVRVAAGDLAQTALGEAIEASMAPTAIAKALREHAPDRPTILFAPTVHSAGVIRDALSASGFAAEVVWGAQGVEARRRVLSDYRAGKVQVLCNVGVLTEGTDLPRTSCIVIARPTRARGLYQQMVGRGLRLDAGKVDCLVLDLVGASSLGLTSCTDLFAEEREEQRKECVCGALMADGELKCIHATCHEGCACGGGPDCGCTWVPAEPVERDEPIYADGPLRSTIVDLFSGAASMWMRTARGVPFIAAGERYIAIVPGDPAARRRPDVPEVEVVSVHWQSRDPGIPGNGRVVMTGLSDFATAMMVAEQDMTRTEMKAAAKDDGFRKRRVKSTETQRAIASSYGISADPAVLASELQVRLAEAGASARIDPCLPDWY